MFNDVEMFENMHNDAVNMFEKDLHAMCKTDDPMKDLSTAIELIDQYAPLLNVVKYPEMSMNILTRAMVFAADTFVRLLNWLYDNTIRVFTLADDSELSAYTKSNMASVKYLMTKADVHELNNVQVYVPTGLKTPYKPYIEAVDIAMKELSIDRRMKKLDKFLSECFSEVLSDNKDTAGTQKTSQTLNDHLNTFEKGFSKPIKNCFGGIKMFDKGEKSFKQVFESLKDLNSVNTTALSWNKEIKNVKKIYGGMKHMEKQTDKFIKSVEAANNLKASDIRLASRCVLQVASYMEFYGHLMQEVAAAHHNLKLSYERMVDAVKGKKVPKQK